MSNLCTLRTVKKEPLSTNSAQKHLPIVVAGWTWVWRVSGGGSKNEGEAIPVAWVAPAKGNTRPRHTEGDFSCPEGWEEPLQPGDVVLRRARRLSTGKLMHEVWETPRNKSETPELPLPQAIWDQWFREFDKGPPRSREEMWANPMPEGWQPPRLECVLDDLAEETKKAGNWPMYEQSIHKKPRAYEPPHYSEDLAELEGNPQLKEQWEEFIKRDRACFEGAVLETTRTVLNPLAFAQARVLSTIEQCRQALTDFDKEAEKLAAFRQGMAKGVELLLELRDFERILSMPETIQGGAMEPFQAASKPRNRDYRKNLRAWLEEFIKAQTPAKRKPRLILSALSRVVASENDPKIYGEPGKRIQHEDDGTKGELSWGTLRNWLGPRTKLGSLMVKSVGKAPKK